jgi:hypothetical protein
MASAKRIRAETRIYDLMNALDVTGYNTAIYRDYFKTLNDTQFTEFMKNIQLFFEVDSLAKDIPDMAKIRSVADKFKIPLVEYVVLPSKNTQDESNPPITTSPIPVIAIQVRRLQQMADKKNAASANTDKVNSITGQVTGDSKAASLSDMQTMALVTSGQIKTIKEFLGPRADDQVAKMKMLDSIERTGEFNIDDIESRTEDKQSVSTMVVFLTCAGFKVQFGNSAKTTKK